jgi:hypothetical protein
MGVLDVVSLAILAILLVGVLLLILIVAAIPGVLAKKRHSPWAEAIQCCWLGRCSLAAYLDAGVDCSVRASSERRRRTNCHQPGGDHRTRYCNCQYLPAPHHSSEQYSRFIFRCSGLWFRRDSATIVGVLVIVWVLVLRICIRKN